MHQKRTRPETMPAYTHKHGEPKTNTRTDKRPVRTQHWLFKPPEFSCLPVPDSPYRMASTVHQTRGRERNFPSRRTGCLPARSLASALRRLECPVCSPLYRKLSSAPDTFLLPSGASDLHWTLLFCLSTGVFIYPSPLSWECSLPPVKGSWMSPQMFCPMSESPGGKREGFQDNAIRKTGKFITDSSQGFCRNQHSGAGSESPAPKLLTKFIGCA